VYLARPRRGRGRKSRRGRGTPWNLGARRGGGGGRADPRARVGRPRRPPPRDGGGGATRAAARRAGGRAAEAPLHRRRLPRFVPVAPARPGLFQRPPPGRAAPPARASVPPRVRGEAQHDQRRVARAGGRRRPPYTAAAALDLFQSPARRRLFQRPPPGRTSPPARASVPPRVGGEAQHDRRRVARAGGRLTPYTATASLGFFPSPPRAAVSVNDPRRRTAPPARPSGAAACTHYHHDGCIGRAGHPVSALRLGQRGSPRPSRVAGTCCGHLATLGDGRV